MYMPLRPCLCPYAQRHAYGIRYQHPSPYTCPYAHVYVPTPQPILCPYTDGCDPTPGMGLFTYLYAYAYAYAPSPMSMTLSRAPCLCPHTY